MIIAAALTYFVWQWCFDGASSTELRNWIIIINVVGWGLQFVGHGVFESTNDR